MSRSRSCELLLQACIHGDTLEDIGRSRAEFFFWDLTLENVENRLCKSRQQVPEICKATFTSRASACFQPSAFCSQHVSCHKPIKTNAYELKMKYAKYPGNIRRFLVKVCLCVPELICRGTVAISESPSRTLQ